MGENNSRAGEDASRSSTSNSTTDDECHRGGSSTAQGGTNLKDDNGDEHDHLGGVEGVDAAPEELGGATGDEVGAGVPADVVERVKIGRDARHSCGDNSSVLNPELNVSLAFHSPGIRGGRGEGKR